MKKHLKFFLAVLFFPHQGYSQLPVADFGPPGNVSICPGTCTDFFNLSINATSYYWIFNGGYPSTSTAVNPTGICYSIPGNYDVTLIAVNSSGSDTLIRHNYILVYPYPPSVGFNIVSDTLFAPPGFVSYQWYFNFVLVPGATDNFYIMQNPQPFDSYTLVAVDINGCEVEATYEIPSGIATAEAENPLVIFPMPVAEQLSFSCKICKENINAVISNVIGEKRMVIRNISPAGKSIAINTEGMQPGIYFLEVYCSGKVFRSEFIRH